MNIGEVALVDGDIEFIKTNEPVLVFRRANKNQSLFCVYNLSPETVRVALSGEATQVLAQAAERKKDRLVLGPSGFAVFEEGDASLKASFGGRVKKRAV
jgi:hypothetical protein